MGAHRHVSGQDRQGLQMVHTEGALVSLRLEATECVLFIDINERGQPDAIEAMIRFTLFRIV